MRTGCPRDRDPSDDGKGEQMAVTRSPAHAGTLVLQEKAKLRRVLGRLDLILFGACAIVGLDTVAFAASVGGQAITWLTVGVAVASFKYGKWGPNIGTIVKILVVGIFFVLAIAFLISKGHPAGTVGAADIKPSISGFLGVVGVLVFLWVGFELSNGASEEMVNPQRDVPVMVVGSGLIAALIYAFVIGGMLLVIPKVGLTNVGGFSDAYHRVAGVPGGGQDVLGPIVGIGIVLTLLCSGLVWSVGSDGVE